MTLLAPKFPFSRLVVVSLWCVTEDTRLLSSSLSGALTTEKGWSRFASRRRRVAHFRFGPRLGGDLTFEFGRVGEPKHRQKGRVPPLVFRQGSIPRLGVDYSLYPSLKVFRVSFWRRIFQFHPTALQRFTLVTPNKTPPVCGLVVPPLIPLQ